MDRVTENQRYTILDVWSKLGITEHLGGVFATAELIKSCNIQVGHRVLDIGCGTGYTACLLARDYVAEVTAADLNPRILELARRRIAKEGVEGKVHLVLADAQELPFKDNSFDRVIAESVIIFTEPQRSVAEAFRVVRHGGIVGINEETFLRIPSRRSLNLLSQAAAGVTLQFLSAEEWKEAFRKAGFGDITFTIHNISPWQQFLSHLQVDGVSRIASSWLRSLTDPTIRAMFLNKEILKAAFELLPSMGYGLYTGKKPEHKPPTTTPSDPRAGY